LDEEAKEEKALERNHERRKQSASLEDREKGRSNFSESLKLPNPVRINLIS